MGLTVNVCGGCTSVSLSTDRLCVQVRECCECVVCACVSLSVCVPCMSEYVCE